MNKKDIFSHIDYTLLKAVSTWPEIEALCRKALESGTACVCIPPAFVKRVRETYKEIRICTVIGFPLGYNTTDVKVFEAGQAIEDGADEIDMVINIGWAKSGDFTSIKNEIKALRQACKGKILKVIIETCYLTQTEKISLCEAVTEAGADFIKTSTGFGTAGATVEDILLMKAHIGEGVKIKASGGIRTEKEMVQYIELGCERIGTSALVT